MKLFQFKDLNKPLEKIHEELKSTKKDVQKIKEDINNEQFKVLVENN